MSAVAPFIAYSFLGWAAETAKTGERRASLLFDRAPVPLLPIYGVGALTVLALREPLAGLPVPVRFGVYALVLSGVELAGCAIEASAGRRSWNYSMGELKPQHEEANTSLQGCVSLRHALLWGAAGLAVERLSP